MIKFPENSRLLIGTNNNNKIVEITKRLQPLVIDFVTAVDLGLPEPDEDGSTFEDNAVIKARAYSQRTGLSVITDDSGLCIPALNHQPGIHTARFGKDHGGFDRAAEYLWGQLDGKLKQAYFHSCVVFMLPSGEYQAFSGQIEGKIVLPRGDSWGFNPIFQPNGFEQTFAEMPWSVRQTIDHRGQALQNCIDACFK